MMWLPLQARWALHTSPCHSPNPPTPAMTNGMWSCDVRPRRFSATNAPVANGRRCGCSSRTWRPVNVSSSVAAAGRASDTVNADKRYSVSPSFVSVLVIVSAPVGSRRTSVVSVSCATASTAVHCDTSLSGPGLAPLAVTACRSPGAKRGDQAVPSGREPIRPGRPANPEPCSGTIANGPTTSSSPLTIGRSSAAANESRSTSTGSDAPQWTMLGTPVLMSSTTLDDDERRWTRRIGGTRSAPEVASFTLCWRRASTR